MIDRTQQQFYTEINDAIKNQDSKGVLTILTEEIGDLLANNRNELIAILRKRGFNVSESTTDEYIANLVADLLIKKNKEFTEDLVNTIAKTKSEYSNIIGLIARGIGAVVEGIANAFTADTRKRAERDVAEEKVRTSKEFYRGARVNLATNILGAKKKVEETKLLVEARKVTELGKARDRRRIAFIASGVFVFGVLFYLITKRN